MRNLFILLAAVMTLGGCSKNDRMQAPRDTIAEYVSRAMAIKTPEDKNKLAELVAGKAAVALKEMNDEQFKEYFIDTSRTFLGLKLRDERAVSETKHSITYELSYKSKSPGGSEDLITLKKHASLEKSEGGRWLITEVQNLKTNIEHQNEFAL